MNPDICIYYSCPLSDEKQYKKSLNYYYELRSFFDILSKKYNCNIYSRFPFITEDFNELIEDEYFYSDILVLEKSNIFICNMPFPAIGSSCELAFFKKQNPLLPAIGLECVEHGWLTKLLDYQVYSIRHVKKIIENIINNI